MSRYAKMVIRLVREGMQPLKAIDLVSRTYRVSSQEILLEVESVLHAE